ncbi:DEKNAAC105291 [Brettanomyces naardenensis]|uniref:DEKNAAC105291 n=1 Tax=Brettanomyces naardenensis TaxID=13370 RepID=A0A448YSV3_BRENA|nr:DEKNAAC105291 [Brettanomyces naardenensis]
MLTPTISSATKQDGYYLYHISITINRDSAANNSPITVTRRYSDFVNLKKTLEQLTNRKVPYELPSKLSHLVKRSHQLVEERKSGLAEFSRRLINDPQYQQSPTVLTFFNIPRTTFMELGNDSTIEKKRERVDGSEEIDSSSKWMESLKDVTSLLQNARTKMLSSSNVVDSKSTLKVCQRRLEVLQSYLDTDNSLGAGERARRLELLKSAQRDCHELDSLATNLLSQGGAGARRGVAHSLSHDEDMAQKDSLFGSRGRTLGKAKETEITRGMDNRELYESQQMVMARQDEDLENMREILERQKKLGMAINDELGVQNEMLRDLGTEVDKSSRKMKHARGRIGKIL